MATQKTENREMATKKPIALNLLLASVLAFKQGNVKKGQKYMAFALEASDLRTTLAAMDEAAQGDDEADDDFDADQNAGVDADDLDAAEATFRAQRRKARRALADIETEQDQEDHAEGGRKANRELEDERAEARLRRTRFNRKLMAALDSTDDEVSTEEDEINQDDDSDDDLDAGVEAALRAALGKGRKK